MKNKLILLTLFITMTLSLSANAQTLDLHANQSLTVGSSSFLPFSTVGNDELIMVLPGDSMVTVTISNSLGGAFTIAPAKDFSEVGEPQLVMGNGTFILDYSNVTSFNGTFGISIVPQQTTAVFEILITPPSATTSSSTSSSTTGGPVTGDLFSPDSLTIIGTFLDQNLADQLSNDSNNQNCSADPSGISSTKLDDSTLNQLFNTLLNTNFSARSTVTTPGNSDFIAYTLPAPKGKKPAKGGFNITLENNTDKTKIFLTGVFPSVTTNQSISVGREFDTDIDVITKEQIDPALAAVQHAIVSATMPGQLSQNGGFFITQGGGCVGPYCAITEQGMVTIIPGGSCTPEVLRKKKLGFPTVNPSKLFDPFISASGVIQIPASSIVDPTHPLISKVVRESNYLIFQPVPPGVKLTQQLKLDLKKNGN